MLKLSRILVLTLLAGGTVAAIAWAAAPDRSTPVAAATELSKPVRAVAVQRGSGRPQGSLFSALASQAHLSVPA